MELGKVYRVLAVTKEKDTHIIITDSMERLRKYAEALKSYEKFTIYCGNRIVELADLGHKLP